MRALAVGLASACLLALAGGPAAQAAPRHRSAISIRTLDRSEAAILRAGRLRVALTGSANYRGTLSVVAPDPRHPRTLIPITRSRFISLRRRHRVTVSLTLLSGGRRTVRAYVATCRRLAAQVRLRAMAQGRHRVTRVALRLPSAGGCVAGAHTGLQPGVAYPGALGGLLGINGVGGRRDPGPAAHFLAGAAVGDFSPPAAGTLPAGVDATATCDVAAGTPLDPFTGPRPWAFMEPYRDSQGTGHYNGPPDPTNGPPAAGTSPTGDPYADCNQNGRWEGNLIGGGGGDPRFYDRVVDPVTSRALVVSNGRQTIAVETTDQEGLFNTYQDAIRAQVSSDGYHLDGVFISATHDESAPDSLGLGGVNSTISGVNDYWLYHWFIPRSAQAIEQAYRAMRPATIRYAEPLEPPDVRQCWSSYPYTDDQRMPTLQAVGDNGGVIATLVDVSQHTETTGFNNGSAVDPLAPPDAGGHRPTLAQENLWLTADWPHFMTSALEQHYGGVAIEMAGSVGSVESPQVYPGFTVSRTPQAHYDASQPAGCNTLFTVPGQSASNVNGTGKVPLGYYAETTAYGNAVAAQVVQALDSGGYKNSATNDLWGERADVCLSDDNLLFAAAAGAGVFAHRPGYDPTCSAAAPVAPNGSTTGAGLKSETAAFRIGDGSFISIPGEVFPFTYWRGAQGPEDMNDPTQPVPTWPIPHMNTPFRFLDGLAEDMVGYIFPPGNATSIPTKEHPDYITNGPNDRFNCHHSDDSEAASANTSIVVANALVPLLDKHDRTENAGQGRYVLGDGLLSRDPEGYAGNSAPSANSSVEPHCDNVNGDTVFHRDPAVGVELANGTVVQPLAWMSLSGLPQNAPDRDTRGYFDASGNRVWLDVYPDVSLR